MARAADFAHQSPLGGTAGEDDLDTESVLHAVADGREAVRRPEAPPAPAAGMNEKRPSLGADKTPPVGDLLFPGDEPDSWVATGTPIGCRLFR